MTAGHSLVPKRELGHEGKHERVCSSIARCPIPNLSSRQYPLQHVCRFHPRQPRVEALEFEAEGLVPDAELVQHRGVQVVDGADVLDGGVAEVVGGAVGRSRRGRRRRRARCDMALL